MRRRDVTLLGLTGTALLVALGAVRVAVGVILDEITITRIMRAQAAARGPANRDAREVGRTTTSDTDEVW